MKYLHTQISGRVVFVVRVGLSEGGGKRDGGRWEETASCKGRWERSCRETVCVGVRLLVALVCVCARARVRACARARVRACVCVCVCGAWLRWGVGSKEKPGGGSPKGGNASRRPRSCRSESPLRLGLRVTFTAGAPSHLYGWGSESPLRLPLRVTLTAGAPSHLYGWARLQKALDPLRPPTACGPGLGSSEGVDAPQEAA